MRQMKLASSSALTISLLLISNPSSSRRTNPFMRPQESPQVGELSHPLVVEQESDPTLTVTNSSSIAWRMNRRRTLLRTSCRELRPHSSKMKCSCRIWNLEWQLQQEETSPLIYILIQCQPHIKWDTSHAKKTWCTSGVTPMLPWMTRARMRHQATVTRSSRT
jgi:hypothetical protein